MNYILLTKDLKLLLKDLKFQIFFLILVVLFILSAISSAVTYQNQMEEFQKDLVAHQGRVGDGNSIQLINMLHTRLLNVNSRPSPAILFSSYSAYPDKINNGIMFYTPTFGKYGTAQRVAFRLNWYFILGILSGFIMLILSFETISSEKRAGTLRLISIYGLKRQAVLWHKYMAYMLLYLIVIVPPALTSMILFFALSGTWSLPFMLKYLLIILLSIPFASFFIWLGIFVSMSRNYRSAIVMIVFIWLLFVIIIPQSANIIAKQIAPTKPSIEYSQQKRSAFNEEWAKWIADYGNSVGGNGSLEDGWRAKAVYASDEISSQINQIEIDDSKRQTLLIQNISSLSPFTQFERISEVLFDKGFYLLEHQQETTKTTINQIRNIVTDQDNKDENSLHLFYSWAENDNSWNDGSRTPPFSTQLFEQPDLLFVSEIKTDDTLTKVVKILLGLLPIWILNLLLVAGSVIKLETLDIR